MGLEEKFDSFNGGGESLGDGAGGTSNDEVLEDFGGAAALGGGRRGRLDSHFK